MSAPWPQEVQFHSRLCCEKWKSDTLSNPVQERQIQPSKENTLSYKLRSPYNKSRSNPNMSEMNFDKYEHYNFDHDKHIYSGHGGKQRSKKEADEHTNHFDPSGHSRKILTKLMNTNSNNNKKACKN